MKRTASSVVCGAVVDTITVFTLTTLLLLPTLTEFVLLLLFPHNDSILVYCTTILMVASVVGGFDLGMYIDGYNSTPCVGRFKKGEQYWCPSFSRWQTIAKGSYIIYSCSMWGFLNVLGSCQDGINWYIKLFTSMPLILYGPFVAAGYTFSNKIRELENEKR